ncbi:hypothetical protein [Amycolatopsis sp. CA-128772]|uniref:hypothetical protein n=1 Tax=Amycolatopsis sp. CA-128772 TaxID=2073159 RepID=UPI000CD16BB5|nr:hypothetical protein [Amycolatopsis sp. CA-128772]
MDDQRQVLVRAEARRITVTGVDGGAETLAYPGVTLTRVLDGTRADERWLPMGDEPSEIDDEVLVTALREAFLWRCGLP